MAEVLSALLSYAFSLTSVSVWVSAAQHSCSQGNQRPLLSTPPKLFPSIRRHAHGCSRAVTRLWSTLLLPEISWINKTWAWGWGGGGVNTVSVFIFFSKNNGLITKKSDKRQMLHEIWFVHWNKERSWISCPSRLPGVHNLGLIKSWAWRMGSGLRNRIVFGLCVSQTYFRVMWFCVSSSPWNLLIRHSMCAVGSQ